MEDEIFSQIRAARMVVLVSDDSDNAEGDLVMAAEKVTPQHVNFMVIQGRGVVSVALPEKRLRELGIPLVPSSLGGLRIEQAGARWSRRAKASPPESRRPTVR